MKFRLSVSDENFESVKEFLSGRGIEIGDDGEYVISEAPGHVDFLAVRNEKKERMRLKTDEVIYIEAFGKDIEIHTEEGTFSSQDRMYQLESQLDSNEFIRVSKSVIIARKHVKKIRPSLSMKYILTMTGGDLVDVTRSYYSDFRRFFNI